MVNFNLLPSNLVSFYPPKRTIHLTTVNSWHFSTAFTSFSLIFMDNPQLSKATRRLYNGFLIQRLLHDVNIAGAMIFATLITSKSNGYLGDTTLSLTS